MIINLNELEKLVQAVTAIDTTQIEPYNSLSFKQSQKSGIGIATEVTIKLKENVILKVDITDYGAW